jgi:hypothetical protein
MGAAHRAHQFFDALTARPGREALAEADRHLPAALRPLFQRMARADQAHALRVLAALKSAGHSHPDLLGAALLHDVGKSRSPPRLWERVLVVLTGWILPAARAWGEGAPSGWRRPYVVARQHPRWGAELVRAAGGSERLAALIERHQDPPPVGRGEFEQLLRALQTADGGL